MILTHPSTQPSEYLAKAHSNYTDTNDHQRLGGGSHDPILQRQERLSNLADLEVAVNAVASQPSIASPPTYPPTAHPPKNSLPLRKLSTAYWALFLVILALPTRPTLIGPQAVSAQELLRVSSKPSCPECRIVANRVARIGTIDDFFTISGLTHLADNGRGEVYFGPLYEPGRIGIFDLESGEGRTIGRPGRGPGEFGRDREITRGAGDTMFVFEINRLTSIAPGGALAKVQPIYAPVFDAVPLENGHFAINAVIRTPSGVGLPFHILERDGTISLSFGEAPPVPDSVQTFSTQDQAIAYSLGFTLERAMAPARIAGFWTAQRMRYELNRWTTDGQMTLRLVRDAEWYPARTHVPAESPWRVPPDPMVWAIKEDSAGRLWVAVRVADANWTPQEPYVPGRVYDTIIEVIDVRNRSLLVSERFPGAVERFLSNGRIAFVQEDPDGLIYFNISQLRLESSHSYSTGR